MAAEGKKERGLTVRAVMASLFAMVATALSVQFLETIEASAIDSSRQAVPVAAMMVFVPIVLVVACLSILTRFRFLNRAEMLGVLFCSMMTAPLASSGFWLMLVGPLGTIPKTAYFEVYDALPEAIWPHSGNITGIVLDPDNQENLQLKGDVSWQERELEHEDNRSIPVLRNDEEGEESAIKFTVPIAGEGDDYSSAVVFDEPYLLSVLARPFDLGASTEYFCRVYTGGKQQFDQEVFMARETGEVNYLHPEGFLRQGMYNLTVPAGTEPPLEIEVGLNGEGELAIAEVELLSVGALNAIYRGRKTIGPEERANLPPGPLPHQLLEEPASKASPEGIKSAVAGVIPWGHWARPFLLWSGFGILILLGTMALGSLMHRQWIENERYRLPNTRIPVTLLGTPGEEDSHFLAGIWKNRIMWVGFGISLFWCLMKGWHAYNANVPDMRIDVDLSPYFTDPAWGKFWKGTEVRNVTFQVTAILLSIAIFLELNVLFSLALGFFLFRFQYLIGEMGGMALQQDYPYYPQQEMGAFLVYGLLILFFARRHLWKTLQSAFGKKISEEPHGPLSYRKAWLLLVFCFGGIVGWAIWAGIGVGGMLLFFAIILLIGLVSMKLRAECGVITGWFGPVIMAAILPITGGMLTYGPEGVIFICIAGYALFQYLFFLTPGMQLEMMELGRQYLMPSRDILGILLLGTVGGILVAGWVHLSLGFGVGGDNYAERWPYMDKTFVVHDYNMALADANLTLLPEDSPERQAAGGMTPAHWGYIFGGGITLVLTFLRQAFSGFWFHPIGFIVGSSPMMEVAWGSVLAAGIIRYITFKIGGSFAVRKKLMPFFVGVFIGAVVCYLIFGLLSAYLYFYHPEVLRRDFGGIL